MGLRERLVRYAAARPRPFVAVAPGATGTRLLVEPELRRRGWDPVDSPADASLLVVCAGPGPELDEAVETVWDDMPGPRARVRFPATATKDEVAAALDGVVGELADVGAQWRDASARSAAGPWRPADEEPEEHSEHAGHEHHMGNPAGLAMAGRAGDRDGLRLDVLHVPLGPVLPDWPAGLRLRLTLQGDVVQAVETEVLGGTAGATPFWDEPWVSAAAGEPVSSALGARRLAASHLDSAGRLLAVAGWQNAADQARLLRDETLAGRAGTELAPRFARYARRTGGSRTLRWMTRGLGVIDQDAAERYTLTGPAARHPGDVAARLAGWLAEIGPALERADDPTPLDGAEAPRGPIGGAPSAALLQVLAALLPGTELAAARLIVASLDPDIEQVGVAVKGVDA